MNSNKIKDWDSRFKIIENELVLLESDRFFYREYLKIIEDNPKLSGKNHFFIWISENYIYSASMGVRRVMDRRKNNNASSLLKLLKEIKKDSRILSRKRYASLFENTGFADDHYYINMCFDKLVGKGKNYISPDEVEKDIENINIKYSKLKKYIDDRIAHSSGQELRDVPKVSDLDDCIDNLVKTFQHYYSIFYAGSIPNLIPVIQYPWKSIFKIPWTL